MEVVIIVLSLLLWLVLGFAWGLVTALGSQNRSRFWKAVDFVVTLPLNLVARLLGKIS